MADGANAPQVTGTASRVARYARIVLNVAAVIVFTSLALLILFARLNRFLCICCAITIAVAALVGIVAGLVRVATSVFCESQMRLGEIIATMLAGGAIAGVLTQIVRAEQSSRLEPERAPVICALVVLGVFLLMGIGSAWGWSVSKRLGEEDAWQRIKHLAFGWLLVVGGFCLPVFLLFTLILLIEHESMISEMKMAYVLLFQGSFLVIPGVLTELKCRKKLAGKTATPKANEQIGPTGP
ncbi:MAG: hypothetical protein NTW87_31940 [Planctomycetota bacterium]|nr:hypothetical protein [Planctomycetota bacterium]